MSDEASGQQVEPIGELSDAAGASSSNPPDDRVGYKNPPKASRFKKGMSGNPKGRPRGRRSFKTELREVLDAKVVVTEGGRKSKVSTSHAMLLRLRQRALNGDVRAINQLLFLAAAHLPADPPENADAMFQEDQDIIDAFLRGPSSSGIDSDDE
jgi:hypothetical protein